ncbi:MAG: thymidine phosphorylase [Bacteroidetes bacterium 46-16]|nr:MAG: thymidine phosphorylase [Bacteroidetes bacterium 46-16]
MHNHSDDLYYRDIWIDTNQELVIYMPESCDVCKSEGFQALTRVEVWFGAKSIIAALNITQDGLLGNGEVALSLSAKKKLNVKDGDLLKVRHTDPLVSIGYIRAKLYGNALDQAAYDAIIRDIADEKYSNVFITAFVSACSGRNMSIEEICYLTQAMINVGNRMSWDKEVVADKHCIGGLPGNRTTMIVVPIIASLNIPIPKTSSRAITSPAGTADTMEVLTNVTLDMAELQAIVAKENGCIAWGGAVKLSPADDIIIRIERALDIDSEAQMIASILSKKVAAGSTHCVIDIPIGSTAKVRDMDSARQLAVQMEAVAKYVGLKIKILFSDGNQPVGEGIGPALEARDVLKVLRNNSDAPEDLKKRALTLASAIVQLTMDKSAEEADRLVTEQLNTGAAYKKLKAICIAQGGFKEPAQAMFSQSITAGSDGTVTKIDNRKVARLAKLAGAPDTPEAGLDFKVKLGQAIRANDELFIIYAGSKGELNYAMDYFKSNQGQIIQIDL